jgi:putative flippase GtrA
LLVATLCQNMTPMIMLISYILCICIAFNFSFVLHYHHVYERGRSSETHNSWPHYSHKIFPCYLYDFLSVLLYTKITNILVTYLFRFGFVNLRAVGDWQPPQLVGDAKMLFCCYRLLEECREGTTYFFPKSSI